MSKFKKGDVVITNKFKSNESGDPYNESSMKPSKPYIPSKRKK